MKKDPKENKRKAKIAELCFTFAIVFVGIMIFVISDTGAEMIKEVFSKTGIEQNERILDSNIKVCDNLQEKLYNNGLTDEFVYESGNENYVEYRVVSDKVQETEIVFSMDNAKIVAFTLTASKKQFEKLDSSYKYNFVDDKNKISSDAIKWLKSYFEALVFAIDSSNNMTKSEVDKLITLVKLTIDDNKIREENADNYSFAVSNETENSNEVIKIIYKVEKTKK